jgi:hypothetical protein
MEFPGFDGQIGDSMKLVLQIAFGVFLGTVPALFMVASWWNYNQEQSKAETVRLMDQFEQTRLEQAEKLRSILIQNQKSNPTLIIPNNGVTLGTDQTSQIPAK